MNGRGQIEITSELGRCYEPPNQGQPAVAVKITDNGPGFSPEAKTALFTPSLPQRQMGLALGWPSLNGWLKHMMVKLKCRSQPMEGPQLYSGSPSHFSPS